MNLKNAYERFKNNYQTENGGINMYPQFNQDLDILLDYLAISIYCDSKPVVFSISEDK